jgi:hypothetical protein
MSPILDIIMHWSGNSFDPSYCPPPAFNQAGGTGGGEHQRLQREESAPLEKEKFNSLEFHDYTTEAGPKTR